MDKITHEIRLNNWKELVEECNNRPNGTNVKVWLGGDGIRKRYVLLDRKSFLVIEDFLTEGKCYFLS